MGETRPASGPGDDNKLPIILFGLVVLLVGVANFVGGTIIGAALVLALIGALAMAARPSFAVILLLASFLVSTPMWLQGRGFLTLNNIVGGFLGMLMVLRVYRTGDWSFLRHREVQLMALITAVYLFSRLLNSPDAHTLQLVQGLVTDDQDPARVIINRLAFLIFFVCFIRTPGEVRFVFLLALALMILSGFGGIWRVLSGGGFAGYRASSGWFVYSAGNPNRMALVANIAIIGLWYLVQWQRRWLVTLPAVGTIGVMILAVFMTGSRSGVLALATTGVLLFSEGGVTLRKILAGALVGGLGLMLVLSAAPEKALERIGNLPGTGSSSSELGAGSIARRSYTAELAVEIANRNPLLGVGIGNWEITRYLEDPFHNTTPPHSSVLLALAEGGIVTLTLYGVLLLWMYRNLASLISAFSGRGQPGWVLWASKTLRTGFLIFLALSLVGDLWLNILFYWFLGLGVVLPRAVWAEEPVEEVDSAMLMEAAA